MPDTSSTVPKRSSVTSSAAPCRIVERLLGCADGGCSPTGGVVTKPMFTLFTGRFPAPYCCARTLGSRAPWDGRTPSSSRSWSETAAIVVAMPWLGAYCSATCECPVGNRSVIPAATRSKQLGVGERAREVDDSLGVGVGADTGQHAVVAIVRRASRTSDRSQPRDRPWRPLRSQTSAFSRVDRTLHSD